MLLHDLNTPKLCMSSLASCVSTRERAWDCGVGNGQSAITLVDYFCEVYATDKQLDMIKLKRFNRVVCSLSSSGNCLD